MPKLIYAAAGNACKLDANLIKKYCNEVLDGHSDAQACVAVGVHRSTFHTWEKKAAAGLEPYLTWQTKRDFARHQFFKKVHKNIMVSEKAINQQLYLARRLAPDEYPIFAQPQNVQQNAISLPPGYDLKQLITATLQTLPEKEKMELLHGLIVQTAPVLAIEAAAEETNSTETDSKNQDDKDDSTDE